MTGLRVAAAVVAVALTAAACAGERPTLTEEVLPSSTTSAPADADPTTATTAPTEPPTTTVDILSPAGRAYPAVPSDPGDLGDRLAVVEQLLRETDPGDPSFADLAHEQQMLYRVLGRNPQWLAVVLAEVPAELAPAVETHFAARRAIAGISDSAPPENVPAWEIIDPLPADELRALYARAEADTGIDWAYLAAINLLETGYGRIAGFSTAGAQGPMQFLPTTWEEVGEGSIDDPRDAIPAAARYLVRRGGPDDMEAALWGYNNSDSYVEAVSTYAEMFRTDEAVFVQTHGWEIHYSAAIADLWFPIGYRRTETVPATQHVAEAPWSLPPDQP